MSQLRDKFNTYLRLAASQRDRHGFVSTDHCDSLLWTGLLAASGLPTDLRAARLPDGRWLRRPTDYPECHSCGGSKSSISRDMLLGLIWGAWRTRDLPLLLDLHKYSRTHYWVMGTGTLTRTLFSPALASTLAHAIRALGGPSYWERHLPAYFGPGATDYQAHLQVLHLLLRREIGLPIPAQRLREHAERQPGNPLFQAAVGRYALASQILVGGVRYWPDGRLPTSADRHDEWLVQRDFGSDWLPSDQGRTHSGGDLLFTARLILASGRTYLDRP